MKRWEQAPIWSKAGCLENWAYPDSRQTTSAWSRYTDKEIAELSSMSGPERLAYYESREAPDSPVDDWRGRAIFDGHIIRH